MKKIIAILGIVSMSSTVFAAECLLTRKSKSQLQLIENSAQMDQATKEFFLNQGSLTTLSEVLACSAANKSISKAEAEIAIVELRKSENRKIQELTHTSIYLENALNDSSLNDFMKNLYQTELRAIPSQIQKERDLVQSLIYKIQKNVK